MYVWMDGCMDVCMHACMCKVELWYKDFMYGLGSELVQGWQVL